MQKWFPEAYREFTVLSAFELLKSYLGAGRIKIDKSKHPQLTTIHDPCNYVRKSQIVFGDHHGDASRWIVSQCCEHVVEMCADPLNNLCCGAGGGAWALPYSEERMALGKAKADQIRKSGAQLVITPCHNSRDQIKKALPQAFDMGNHKETMYIWELVAKSLEITPWREPKIKEARSQRDAQFERDNIRLEPHT